MPNKPINWTGINAVFFLVGFWPASYRQRWALKEKILSKGFYRLGVVLSVVWIISICSFAIYEWQAPFYKKTVFFFVVSHPEAVGADGAIPVTTPFLIERFIFILASPLIGLWLLLLVRPVITWVRNGFKP